MDFDDTPEEAAFRAEARAFLKANAARKQRTSGAHRYGDTDAAEIARAKAWQAKKADAGFAGITWPKEWGGRGGTADAADHLEPGRSGIRRRRTTCS